MIGTLGVNSMSPMLSVAINIVTSNLQLHRQFFKCSKIIRETSREYIVQHVYQITSSFIDDIKRGIS